VASQQDRFGERLRRYREAAGYSQEALAERAGLSANAISALERGERKRPYPDTLRRLAEALGLTNAERADFAIATSREQEVRVSTPSIDRVVPPRISIDLPGEPTPLIGREHEIEVVGHLLENSNGRLLTLTGPGGVGKTRLALNVARGMSERFPDGVVWVELAPLGEHELVIPSLARALGLEEALGDDQGEALRTYLRGRSMLVVLDNMEHLLDAVTDIADLLHSCPGIGMLVTSRARLNIRGEQIYEVPPLELPTPGRMHDPGAVASIPSVQLFVWLIQQRDPSFELTEENATYVAEICRRLDGVPLALELVSPKVKLLGIPALLNRLDHALPVLTGGPRDLPTRQQTMEGAVRWSYDLLKPAERALFRRLSVFAGGWGLDAAESVVTIGGEPVGDVLRGIESLADQSLLRQVVEYDSATRFSMLETLREFGLEQLSEAREREVAQLAHLRWCISLAEAAEKGLAGREQSRWLQRLETEHDNIRAALGLTLVECDEERLRLAGALWRFWWWHGHFSEGRAWLAQVLDRGSHSDSAWRGKALTAAGILAREQGDFGHARTMLEESLAIRRRSGDQRGAAQALNILGLVASSQGDLARAKELFEEGLSVYREAGDQLGVANVLNNLGSVWRDEGQFARAAALYTESMEVYKSFGERRGLSVALHNLGRVANDMGDPDRALELFDECLAIEQELGDRLNLAMTLHNMGRVTQERGLYARTAELYVASLNIRIEFGDKLGCAKVIEDVAAMAGSRGDPERAVRLQSATALLRQRLGAPVPPADRDRHERIFDQAQSQLDAEALENIIARGRVLTIEEAVIEALSYLERCPQEHAGS
jgi:predicted ATPase/transcriptional regulator with XRE-family HTH domain/Tfp pilus assembly protein PilF